MKPAKLSLNKLKKGADRASRLGRRKQTLAELERRASQQEKQQK